MRNHFILRPGEDARERMAAAWRFACEFLEMGKSAKVEVSELLPKIGRASCRERV